MKKTLLILCGLALGLLAGERSVIGSLPLPPKIVITSECDSDCMQALRAQKEAEAFIRRMARHGREGEMVTPIETPPTTTITLGGKGLSDMEQIKIALLVPRRVIHAYAQSVSNAIIAYLLRRGSDFQLDVIDSGDESQTHLQEALERIREGGYAFVVAPLTKRGADIVCASESALPIFIPTINRQDVAYSDDNVIFGGIDYKRQIDALLSIAAKKVAIFSDGSPLATRLSDYIHSSSFGEIVYEKSIKNIRSSLVYLLKENKKLDDASIFLNMPVVKSALMVAQLRYYDRTPYNILSTQINYNPLLLSLTQREDRERLYIANSIAHEDPRLLDTNLLLGNNPRFSWIEYSVSIGMDHYFGDFAHRLFAERIDENQISYGVTLYKAGASSFEPVSSW